MPFMGSKASSQTMVAAKKETTETEKSDLSNPDQLVLGDGEDSEKRRERR